jgi:hypothetical protein
VQDVVQRIAALPGVSAAAASTALPLQGTSGLPFDIVNHPLARGAVRVGWTSVSPDYFRVFEIPILRGRAFTERDDRAAPGVVIISQTMARKFWPDRDPIGELITIGQGYAPGFDEPPREIVGIAADIHDDGLDRTPEPRLYVPFPQVAEGLTALLSRVVSLAWMVRTRVDPHSSISAIENEMRQASNDLSVANVRTMDEIFGAVHGSPGFQHVADGALWRLRSATRDYRHLRLNGVRGETTHAGNRDSAGIGGRTANRAKYVGVARHAPRRDRGGDGHRRRLRALARAP